MIIQGDSFNGIYLQLNFGLPQVRIRQLLKNELFSTARLLSHSVLQVSGEYKYAPNTDLIDQSYEKVNYLSQIIANDPARLLLAIMQLSARLVVFT